ncbi:MAG: hypothetical protein AB3N17_05100, partial [Tateyamaria sp.]
MTIIVQPIRNSFSQAVIVFDEYDPHRQIFGAMKGSCKLCQARFGCSPGKHPRQDVILVRRSHQKREE